MSVAASPEAPPPGDYGPVRFIAGISALAREYDGFILDQWGVLHDGTRAYPGAIDGLRRLRAAGKRVVILSNSGRSEAANVRIMAGLGFPATLFDRFVSAGEDARDALARRTHPFHAKLGRRYFAFLREGDESLLQGLGLERTDRVDDADFLVVVGISHDRGPGGYEPELARAAERRLPMVCANPDIARVSPAGLVDAPGVIARRYEELGGQVFYHGKPWPAIYQSCLQALGCPRERVVAVGDSLDHDVLGAARAGIACAFVAGGIHLEALGAPWGAPPHPGAWQRLMETAPARPAWLVPAFAW